MRRKCTDWLKAGPHFCFDADLEGRLAVDLADGQNVDGKSDKSYDFLHFFQYIYVKNIEKQKESVYDINEYYFA